MELDPTMALQRSLNFLGALTFYGWSSKKNTLYMSKIAVSRQLNYVISTNSKLFCIYRVVC